MKVYWIIFKGRVLTGQVVSITHHHSYHKKYYKITAILSRILFLFWRLIILLGPYHGNPISYNIMEIS